VPASGAWGKRIRAAVTLTLVLGLGSGPHSEAAVALTPCHRWRSVPFPELSSGTLLDVSGSSLADVWAVGGFDYTPATPIVAHWDGTQWAQESQTGIDGILYGVDALSAEDAWAVGSLAMGPAPLTEHWDGKAWREVPAPSPGDYDELYSIAAIAPDDAWAVGTTTADGNGLIEHWDGSTWNVVTGDDPQYGDILYAVSATATNDVWAVGYQATEHFGEFQPFMEHWDGYVWNRAAFPTASERYQQLPLRCRGHCGGRSLDCRVLRRTFVRPETAGLSLEWVHLDADASPLPHAWTDGAR
jgi:hypothetical protein